MKGGCGGRKVKRLLKAERREARQRQKINKKNLDLALGNLVNKLLVITNIGVTARQKESNKCCKKM